MNPFGNIIEYSINYSYIHNSDGTTYTESFMLKGNVIPVREKYSWYEWQEFDSIAPSSLQWTETDGKGNSYDYKYTPSEIERIVLRLTE